MKHKNKLFLWLTLAIVGLASCKKEFNPNKSEIGVGKTKIYKTPSTPQEIKLVQNLSKISDIFKEMYKDKSNLKLVNAAIYSKTYTDESIMLLDLIFPSESKLNNNKKFVRYANQWNVSLNNFSNNFWQEVNQKGNASFKTFLNKLNINPQLSLNNENAVFSGNYYNEQLDVTVYFPYSEEFLPPVEGNYTYDPVVNIVTATADADEGWGSQAVYLNGAFQYYQQVLVNDDFAFENPTHIIGVNGVEMYDLTVETPLEAFPPDEPINVPNIPREVKQVYVGDIRINGTQFDALISFSGNGGGAEIRFTRADGFLQVVNGQVTLANTYFLSEQHVSRRAARKKNWVNVAQEWDGDWELDNHQQNLGIYEEDNRNTTTFNGTLTTSVTIPIPPITTQASRSIGFSIVFNSDDALIRQINLNRDVFFGLNRINLEGEMRNGWPVRDKNGQVSYTLNDRTLY
ncbi:MAG: hypothetical protein ACOVNY_11590 [Chitinophagaceae bacterium]